MSVTEEYPVWEVIIRVGRVLTLGWGDKLLWWLNILSRSPHDKSSKNN